MKHQVYISLLLFVYISLHADFDKHSIVNESDRIGRFSYEDSFDDNLVEKILKNSPAAVKRNVKRLLYPEDDDDNMQRLLLLGGESNAATTAIAKAIAVRCGYEYYVIEASALMQSYREGRQMLLSEVRPIIKQGKPIAIIITELAEMADYSGILASTLWLLIDQCAQYKDVFVIATSAFKQGQLSEEIKERFGRDIISINLDQKMKNCIEKEMLITQTSWLERNKIACCIVGGLVFCALGVAHLYAQWLFVNAQEERDSKMTIAFEAILSLGQKQHEMQTHQCKKQDQQHEMQKKQYNMQIQQGEMQKQQCEKQDQQHEMQKTQHGVQIQQYEMQKQQCEKQNQQHEMQKKQHDVQIQQCDKQNLQYEMQKQQCEKQDLQYQLQYKQYFDPMTNGVVGTIAKSIFN